MAGTGQCPRAPGRVGGAFPVVAPADPFVLATVGCITAWIVLFVRSPDPLLPDSSLLATLFQLCVGTGGIAFSPFAWAYEHLVGHGSAVIAMMTPLALPALVRMRAEEHGAGVALAFLVAFLGPWLIVGVALDAIRVLLLSVEPSGLLGIAVAANFAAVWQLTPCKVRALEHHRRDRAIGPDQTSGRDERAVVLGLRQSATCMSVCGGLMAVATFAGHAPLAALIVTLMTLWERFCRRPHPELIALALLTTAGVAAAALA